MKNCFFSNVTALERKLPYFLHCSAWEYDQEEIDRPEGCPWYQLNICRSGNGILRINGVEQEIKAGDSMIIYPDVPHQYYAVGGPMIVSWIAFDGFQTGSMLKSIGIDTSGLYRLSNNREIHRAIKKTLELERVNISQQGFRGSQEVYSFLLTIMRGYEPLDGSGQNKESLEKIQPALEYMRENLAESVGIEDISRAMNVSSQHFCLLFKQALNQRPFEYFNSLRLNFSKNLLIDNPDLPLKEVSRMSGYPSHSYYCQLFKRQERLTPAEFRKLYRRESSIARSEEKY